MCLVLQSRPALADPIRVITERVTPVSELGYERCRDELIEVVKGGLDLDASLTLWERGEALGRRCEEHLAGARARIEAALAAAEGDSGS